MASMPAERDGSDARIVAAVRVEVLHRDRRGETRPAPIHLGLDDHLVIGRPDDRLSAGGDFRPWPGDAGDRTLPRQAVRIDLLPERVRFTLADAFRGSLSAAPTVEVALDGRRLTTEELRAPALDRPVRGVGDAVVLVLHRRTGRGEPESLTVEVHAQYAVEDGLETVPAIDPSRLRAIAALRDRWWAAVHDLQVGRLFLAAAELGVDRVPDADRAALRSRLLTRIGRAPDERLDQLVGSAVRSLVGASRGEDPTAWDAHLRVLNLAPLYTTEAVTVETDGGREYGRFGDLDAFLLLTARLRDALVLPAPAARRPRQATGGSARAEGRAVNQAFDAGT